ncbi:MAG: ATP-binding protein [Chitinophagaceae bacterium]
MLCKDVIGQQQVKQHLIEMVEQNRLSHALLFLGKEGSGALPLALAFSQYVILLPLNNAAPNQETSLFDNAAEEIKIKLPATADAADAWMEKQPSFAKASALVHPDIHFSFPVVTKKSGTPPVSSDYISEWREFIAQYPYGNVYDWLQFIDAENKQGNITAQECNDINRKLSLKSFESGYKILLMWMPEFLGKEGNKLLKLIEEPPPDTLFILVAENETAILPTIVSRCQLVKIPAIDSLAIEKALINKSNCKPDQARQLAIMSEGNYREALHLLQHAEEDFYSLLREWLNATLKNNPVAQVKCIEEIARLGREKQKQFLRYFTHLIEQAVRFEASSQAIQKKLSEAMPAVEQEFISRLNKAMSLEQKEAVANELDNATYYIERNANAKILFHALTIKLFHIIKNNVVVSV